MAINAKTPWKSHLGELPFHLDYFQGTMVEGLRRIEKQYPNYIAFDFMGKAVSYRQMIQNIDACAKALKTLGVKVNERVTVALPNCPQAIYIFYALNCIGAIASMVHPLSAERELEFYITRAKSRTVVTLDQFYGKFANIRKNIKIENLILASVKDELKLPLKIGYSLTAGRKIAKLPANAPIIRWKDFIAMGRNWKGEFAVKKDPTDTAVILYSGGTTGTTKGIELTNLNFNALGAQITAVNPMFKPGDKMLAAMPVFHGFGLGVCIHSMLFNGGRCILVPRFTPKSYANLMVKKKCNFVAGVPTLYEALLRLDNMEKADLSHLKGVFSGGDSLSIELKKKLDQFLAEHHAPIQVREGYGTTETVTACCLTPPSQPKEGSIGVPFPDTYIKIVAPDSEEELPYGEEGEILLAGPTAMKGYMDNPEETAKTLRKHADGLTWVYTGDLGKMDEEGFVYFKGRIKRMIVSSGYNIYPAQMENILDAHPMVSMSCVIGIPDPYKIQKVKAFVVLKPGFEKSEDTWLRLMAYCQKNVAKYSMPCDLEFRDELPKTLVGKVAYRKLEEVELARMASLSPEEKNKPDAYVLKKEAIYAMAKTLDAENK